jgi:hypothetical protein
LSSGEVVVTSCRGWNPRSEGASRDRHREPFSGEKGKAVGKAKIMKVKDQRRRPDGGEWEPNKIPRKNSAYIPNRT